MDLTDSVNRPEIRDLLGAVMSDARDTTADAAVELDVVALLTSVESEGLSRGQVGTVVELLDDVSALVEFSDDQGRAYAVAACRRADLLPLRYALEAA